MARRPQPPPRREALPFALLLLALASAFAFGHDRAHFYRADHHDWLTVRTLTIAANLAPEHRFLGFIRRKIGEDGEPQFVEPYNRFPHGVYAAVRLATLPAGDDLDRQVLAARLLMLAFFAGAAAAAYLALRRLLGSRWIALAATLLAFSSYCLLYYNDMVASEIASLFGVMLTFHGMVLFRQEGRFRPLLARTALALLLGWHALALAAPFAVLGLASEIARAGQGGAPPGARRRLAAAVRSRYLAYGLASALWCALLVGFNFANEYLAFEGRVAPADLPSFRSMLGRLGNDPVNADTVGWLPFLRGQLGAIGGTAAPWALAERLGIPLGQPTYGPWPADARWAVWGAAVAAACFAGLRFLPQRMLFATLLLAGWCWAVPFRGSASLHEFEAMFHLGAPLVLWTLALLGLRRLAGRRSDRLLPALAAASMLVFALSAWRMGGVGHDAAAGERQRETAADFTAIRGLARGATVLAHPIDHALITRQHRRNYWLAGSYTQIEPFASGEEWRALPDYDYVVLPAGLGGSLTPDNRRYFLYRLGALPGVHSALAAREPAARGRFDVRAGGGTLTWTREPCEDEDTRGRFFVEVTPLAAADLPAGRREAGFEAAEFAFRDRGVRFNGVCMAAADLPAYGIARIATGQRGEDGAEEWRAEFAPSGGR